MVSTPYVSFVVLLRAEPHELQVAFFNIHIPTQGFQIPKTCVHESMFLSRPRNLISIIWSGH